MISATTPSPPFAGDRVTVLSLTLSTHEAPPAPSAGTTQRQRQRHADTTASAKKITTPPAAVGTVPAASESIERANDDTTQPDTAARADSDGAASEAARTRVQAQFHADLDRYFKNSYPSFAIQRGWQGTVWLKLRIEPSGKLEQIQLADSSGYSVLDRSAVETAREIGYLPGANRWLNGQPLEMRVPIVYQLRDR